MCVVPDKVKKAVLYVPAGIKNAPSIRLVRMAFPMLLYWVTHKQKWLKRSILPMAVTEDNIDSDTFETAKCSIDYAKIKAGMPSNVNPKDMKKCLAPTLVLAGENDCMFPANLVMPQAKKIIPNCSVYLLKNRGHINKLTDAEKKNIIAFLMG